MKNEEFRSIINLNPILLYKQNLYELEMLIKDDQQKHKNDSFEITIVDNERHLKVKSFDELFSYKNLPLSIERMSINYTGWRIVDGQSDINRSISLDMHHNSISYYSNSNDETWYKGKSQRIREFFKKYEPWYSFFQKIPVLFGLIDGVSVIMLLGSIVNENFKMIVISSFLLIFFISITGLSFQQKLFPFVRIVLEDRKKVFNREAVSFLLLILGTLTTCLQLILQFQSHKH